MRAAFLIGAADAESAAASTGVIDYAKVLMAAGEVEDACQRLQDPNNRQQQVLLAASAIAKSTSGLCNLCKTATAKTNNPVAKNQFVASAKAIAGGTGALVANIKVRARQCGRTPHGPVAHTLHTLPRTNFGSGLYGRRWRPRYRPRPARHASSRRCHCWTPSTRSRFTRPRPSSPPRVAPSRRRPCARRRRSSRRTS